MAQYNGYKNWNQWNVSLWINNDEWLYNAAVIACKTNTKEKAADILTNLSKPALDMLPAFPIIPVISNYQDIG